MVPTPLVANSEGALKEPTELHAEAIVGITDRQPYGSIKDPPGPPEGPLLEVSKSVTARSPKGPLDYRQEGPKSAAVRSPKEHPEPHNGAILPVMRGPGEPQNHTGTIIGIAEGA